MHRVQRRINTAIQMRSQMTALPWQPVSCFTKQRRFLSFSESKRCKMCLDLNFYNKRVKRFFCFKVWDLYFQEKKNKSIFELSVSYKQAFTTAVTFFVFLISLMLMPLSDVCVATVTLPCFSSALVCLYLFIPLCECYSRNKAQIKVTWSSVKSLWFLSSLHLKLKCFFVNNSSEISHWLFQWH